MNDMTTLLVIGLAAATVAAIFGVLLLRAQLAALRVEHESINTKLRTTTRDYQRLVEKLRGVSQALEIEHSAHDVTRLALIKAHDRLRLTELAQETDAQFAAHEGDDASEDAYVQP